MTHDATLPTTIDPQRIGPFRLGYASWIVVAAIALVLTAFATSDATARKSAMCFLLAPVLVFASARWVAAAASRVALVRRAVLAHFGAAYAAMLLIGVARTGDPGFSGHGGAVLLLIVMLPYCAVAAAVLGVLGAWTGALVARTSR